MVWQEYAIIAYRLIRALGQRLRPSKMSNRIMPPAPLGDILLTHFVPEVNLFWWQSFVQFSPVGRSVHLSLICQRFGPSIAHTECFQALVDGYALLIANTDVQRDLRAKLGSFNDLTLVSIEISWRRQISLEFA